MTCHVIQTGRSVAFPGHPLGSGLTHAAAQASDVGKLYTSPTYILASCVWLQYIILYLLH